MIEEYIKKRREELIKKTGKFISDNTQDEIYNRIDELDLLLKQVRVEPEVSDDCEQKHLVISEFILSKGEREYRHIVEIWRQNGFIKFIWEASGCSKIMPIELFDKEYKVETEIMSNSR